MIEIKTKPNRVRFDMASEHIDFQDIHPAHLASKDITRQIRVEAQSARRLSDEPLKSLLLSKNSTNPLFKYCIHQVGLDPFYVHIWTPKQLKIYNLHNSKTYSRLFLDATGGVIQKLQILAHQKWTYISVLGSCSNQ